MPSAADARVGRNEASSHLRSACSRDVSGHAKDRRESRPCYAGAVLGDVRSDVGQHAGDVPPQSHDGRPRSPQRADRSVQLLRHGLDLELHLALNGDTPYFSRIFHTPDELLAWAEEERVQNLGSGTTSSEVSRTPTLPCAFARTNPATESAGWS